MSPRGWRRLGDLTTRGQGVQPDAAAVAPAGWPSPESPVPGRQLAGELRGQGRFLLRLPDDWNGHLVVAGTPGTRTEYAGDLVFSDFVLSRGYAYLAGDKGGTGGGMVGGARPTLRRSSAPFGLSFALLRPSVTIEGWTTSLLALTRFAREQLAQVHGGPPERTYLLGISNGGYQARRLLETAPELFDGGVDWEGVHWDPAGPNLLTSLGAAIREYPAYADPRSAPTQRETARQAILAAGFPPDSEALWATHARVYWSLTQWLFVRKLDPDYRGDPADYDLQDRPNEVRDRLGSIATTGAIGRPMISLHGTLDCLLPPAIHALPYAAAVRAQGRAHLHRLYLVERGNHIDNFAALLPAARLEPMLPHVQAALELLVEWVERGLEPPASRTISAGDSRTGLEDKR